MGSRLKEALFHQVSTRSYVLFLTGLAAWFIAVISPYPVAAVVGGLMVGTAASFAWREAHPRKKEPNIFADYLAKERTPERDAKFCPDCGRRFVPWNRQDGFNTVTGKPQVVSRMACQSWDIKADQAAEAAWYANLNTSPFQTLGRVSYQSTYGCGNRKITGLKAMVHNHEDKNVSSTCIGCIEDMVANGVLARNAADSMIEMLG